MNKLQSLLDKYKGTQVNMMSGFGTTIVNHRGYPKYKVTGVFRFGGNDMPDGAGVYIATPAGAEPHVDTVEDDVIDLTRHDYNNGCLWYTGRLLDYSQVLVKSKSSPTTNDTDVVVGLSTLGLSPTERYVVIVFEYDKGNIINEAVDELRGCLFGAPDNVYDALVNYAYTYNYGRQVSQDVTIAWGGELYTAIAFEHGILAYNEKTGQVRPISELVE